MPLLTNPSPRVGASSLPPDLRQQQFRFRPTRTISVRSSLLEELVTISRLRVVRILDFQPRRSAGTLVGAFAPFGDDAFKIPFTCHAVEVCSLLLDVIDITDSGFNARHDTGQ